MKKLLILRRFALQMTLYRTNSSGEKRFVWHSIHHNIDLSLMASTSSACFLTAVLRYFFRCACLLLWSCPALPAEHGLYEVYPFLLAFIQGPTVKLKKNQKNSFYDKESKFGVTIDITKTKMFVLFYDSFCASFDSMVSFPVISFFKDKSLLKKNEGSDNYFRED